MSLQVITEELLEKTDLGYLTNNFKPQILKILSYCNSLGYAMVYDQEHTTMQFNRDQDNGTAPIRVTVASVAAIVELWQLFTDETVNRMTQQLSVITEQIGSMRTLTELVQKQRTLLFEQYTKAGIWSEFYSHFGDVHSGNYINNQPSPLPESSTSKPD